MSQQTQQVHPSEITNVRSIDQGTYIKAFLLDDSINAAKWRIKTDYIPKHIERFVGRPFIITKEHFHPLEFDNVRIDYDDIDGTIKRLLDAQEQYRVGTIKKVERSINPAQAAFGATWNAYIQITNPEVANSYLSQKAPRYVSASIFRLNRHESPEETTDFEPLHLAAVDNPAYGIYKAGVRGSCSGDLIKCSSQLAQASLLSSYLNTNVNDALVNLTVDNAEQQSQVTQSPTGISTTNNSNVVDNTNTPQQPTQQQQVQPTQQTVTPMSGNTAPFKVQQPTEQSQAKVTEVSKPSEEELSKQSKTINDMAALMTKYEALLNRVNELESFKQITQKTEEENKAATKRQKIENAIPGDYADSPEERTKAIESLMKLSDGPELDYVLEKFVNPVTSISPCALAQARLETEEKKGVQEAANKNKASFMRTTTGKRITDYANTKPSNIKKPVAQAAVDSAGQDNVDLVRLRRICTMGDIVSNNLSSGGRFQ